jgi:CrcB protein
VQKLLLLALAGAIGTLARYGLVEIVQNWVNKDFPWGTAAVNLVGCFLFGLVWAMFENTVNVQTRTILLTGFMGAFTTFSTFAFETEQRIEDSAWWLVAGNMLLQNGGGLACIFLGLIVGRLF